MRPCRLFVTGGRTNVTLSALPPKPHPPPPYTNPYRGIDLAQLPPAPLPSSFWIFRTLRTNHHHHHYHYHCYHHYHHQYHYCTLWMTKRNEVVATAHLGRQQRGPKGRCWPCWPEKDRNKACREKEKSDPRQRSEGRRGIVSLRKLKEADLELSLKR